MQSSFNQFWRWLDQHQPSESIVMGGAAILVGLTAGIGIWLFKSLIELAHVTFFEDFSHWLASVGSWRVILFPVIGGVVAGLIIQFFVGEERHHGVAGIMESVALAGGRLRFWRIPAKAVSAAISIGSGASVGPEDPSVQIGANLGSMFGQWLRLSDTRVRSLVAAGSAAGISAAFNAPIAGVFFALEIILGEISGSALGTVVISAVTSAVFTQAVSGPQPAFQIPPYAFSSVWELPLYFGLGLAAGPLAAFYIRLLYTAHDFFHRWHVSRWLKTAAAGLAVGITGFFLPQIFGEGYTTIESILTGEKLAFSLLLVLIIVKPIITSISIGGGFPGGVFAPAMYIGAVLGGGYSWVMQQIFPSLNITTPAFAMVGMAAVLAGAVHSPLTAILLLFEMTNDYHIILPLMFSVIISLVISQHIHSESVYTLSLLRKGIRIEHGRDVDVLDSLTVEEVMQAETQVVLEHETLLSASESMERLHSHGLPVVNSLGELIGVVSIQDIEFAQTREAKNITVGDICTRDLLVAYPDEPIGIALRRMSVRDVGRMPVVRRDNPKRLVGILRRNHLIRAYDIAVTRRAVLRHKADQVRLGAYSGATIEEISIEKGSPCEGKAISEIAWPTKCIIASIRRGRDLLIPHGETILLPRDVLVYVADGNAVQQVKKLCTFTPVLEQDSAET